MIEDTSGNSSPQADRTIGPESSAMPVVALARQAWRPHGAGSAERFLRNRSRRAGRMGMIATQWESWHRQFTARLRPQPNWFRTTMEFASAAGAEYAIANPYREQLGEVRTAPPLPVTKPIMAAHVFPEVRATPPLPVTMPSAATQPFPVVRSGSGVSSDTPRLSRPAIHLAFLGSSPEPPDRNSLEAEHGEALRLPPRLTVQAAANPRREQRGGFPLRQAPPARQGRPIESHSIQQPMSEAARPAERMVTPTGEADLGRGAPYLSQRAGANQMGAFPSVWSTRQTLERAETAEIAVQSNGTHPNQIAGAGAWSTPPTLQKIATPEVLPHPETDSVLHNVWRGPDTEVVFGRGLTTNSASPREILPDATLPNMVSEAPPVIPGRLAPELPEARDIVDMLLGPDGLPRLLPGMELRSLAPEESQASQTPEGDPRPPSRPASEIDLKRVANRVAEQVTTKMQRHERLERERKGLY